MRPPVLLIINSLRAGGAEKQALLISTSVVAAGYPCELYVLTEAAKNQRIHALIAEAESKGVRIVTQTSARNLLGVLWALYRRAKSATVPPVLWSWGHRADLVCVALRLIRNPSALICSLRSADAMDLRRRRRFWRWLDRASPFYVSNSQRNLDYLEEICPGASARGLILHNALDRHEVLQPRADLSPPLAGMNVVMLGNIRIHLKGYDSVVALAAEIKKRALPIRITIAGLLYEGAALRGLIEQAGVADIVTLVGAVHDVPAFLRTGDAFLLMSRVEGMPNALLEAMALGLPCISTRVGDVEQLFIDRTHFRAVDFESSSQVLAILEQWLNDWSEAQRLGCAAAALTRERFGVDRLSQAVRAFLNTVVGGVGDRLGAVTPFAS